MMRSHGTPAAAIAVVFALASICGPACAVPKTAATRLAPVAGLPAEDEAGLVGAPTVRITTAGASMLSLEFQFPTLESKDITLGGVAYRTVEIPGGRLIGNAGEPGIPVFSRWIAIPEGLEPEVDVQVLEQEELDGYRVAPVEGGGPAGVNARAYARDAFEPSVIASIGKVGVLRGVRIAPLNVQPVRYNPVSGSLRVARRVKVDIRFRNRGGTRPDLAGGAARRVIAPSFETLYRRLVVNFDQALAGRRVAPGTWVVICPDDATVTAKLAPLLDWRRRQGFPVRLATTAETGTTKEAIQAWLRNAYQTWDAPPEYVALAGDATAPYMIPTWQENLSGMNGEGDLPYAELDGDDVLPDVHVGRLSFASLSELEAIVNKIISYESAPYLDDPTWLGRACLVADIESQCFSGRTLQQWAKTRLREMGYAEIDTIWYPPIITQMQAALNRGDTILSYRGTLRMSGWTNAMTYTLSNGRRLPFVVALTCETGSFLREGTCLSEGFLRANAGANNPRGGIGAIGTATPDTHTRYNDCMQYGILQGLLYEGQTTLGGALTRGKLEMYANYEQYEPDQVTLFCHWNNLMGDPAVDCWTEYPQPLTVTYPPSLPVGTNSVIVEVKRSGNPEPGARVCLWNGGTGQFTGTTDELGQIALPVTATVPVQMMLTVTKHDRQPFLATIPVVNEPVYVGYQSAIVNDDNLGQSQGNGDGRINPGETIELQVALENFGSDPAIGVSATLTSVDPYVTVTDGGAQFGDIPAGGTVWASDAVVFALSPGCPAGHRLRFALDVASGASQWRSMIELSPVAPDLVAQSEQVQDGGNGLLDPGETVGLIVTLRNDGGMDASGVQGQLLSRSPWITVIDGSGVFGSVLVGQTGANAGDPFTIAAAPGAYRGASAGLDLITLAQGGMSDTTAITLQLGTASGTDPTGGDAYGYFALDDTDAGYPDAPVYSWVEIDPAQGGGGSEIVLGDLHSYQDASATLELPFNFQFHGDHFTRATVCSNGWIAFGSTYLTTYRNLSIPGAGSPANLLAVFWDDLDQTQGGKVLQKYDSANHRWIVEWYQARNTADQSVETFEAVLYDPAYRNTSSGDGIIDFQYRTVSNPDNQDGYATVGIQNGDHTDGLLYTYANLYPPGAAPLAGGRAIRFVPTLAPSRGRLDGVVRNASWGGIPVSRGEVQVLGQAGKVVADTAGAYLFRLPEGVYSVVSGGGAFEPDTVTGVVVSLSQSAHVDFSLTDVAGPTIAGVTDFGGHRSSPGPYSISATVTDPSTVQGVSLFWRKHEGLWAEVAMNHLGSTYSGVIPLAQAGERIQYYIQARDGIGRVSTSPDGSPSACYAFRVTVTRYAYDVESAPAGWQMGVVGDDATHGIWVRTAPNELYFGGRVLRPNGDHTPPPGTTCFFTGSGTSWVAAGHTTLQSPTFDLSGAAEAFLDYYRFYSEYWLDSPAEGFTVSLSSDGGGTWRTLETLYALDDRWRKCDFRLNDFIQLTSQVVVRFVATEAGDNSYVEAGVDDFSIETAPLDPASAPDGPRPVLALLPVRPNPISADTAPITFAIPQPGRARVEIYDVEGRLVRRLVDSTQPAGSITVDWDGRNDRGIDVGSGVFFCRLQFQGRALANRIVRLR